MLYMCTKLYVAVVSGDENHMHVKIAGCVPHSSLGLLCTASARFCLLDPGNFHTRRRRSSGADSFVTP